MRLLIIFISLLWNIYVSGQQRPVDYVNPLIGTSVSRWLFFASAHRPWGMVSLSPDTEINGTWNAGYLYDSLHIYCFSHIHEWQLAGVPVMPVTGNIDEYKGLKAYRSGFSHDSEIVKPGYHKVHLDDYNIDAELTATMRTGFHRYTFPETENAQILLDMGANIGQSDVLFSETYITSDKTLEGKILLERNVRRAKDTWLYFAIKLDKKMEAFRCWQNNKFVYSSENMVSGSRAGVLVSYSTRNNEQVQMKVGLSYTSVEQAWHNMDSELPHWDFDQVVKESLDEWNRLISNVTVGGGTEAQKTKFYTDVWRSIRRSVVSDVEGSYCDMTGDTPVIRNIESDLNGKPVCPQHNFDAFYGAQWSGSIFWSIAFPEIMDRYVASMVRVYQHGGMIPRGPSGGNYTYVMIACPSTPLVAAACNKGISRYYDPETAYQGIYKNTGYEGIRTRNGYDHIGTPLLYQMKNYKEKGYVAYDNPHRGYHSQSSTSLTLHFAYQDWCVAQMAKKLGHQDHYNELLHTATNYKNLFDTAVGYMRPRLADGEWLDGFSPVNPETFESPGFCEASSAVGSHFVPHDPAGLIELWGGPEKYSVSLNQQFMRGEKEGFVVPHGKHGSAWVDYENEEGIGMAHMFNYCGMPWLTQYWTRQIYNKVFSGTSPWDGYIGDEDQGLMSSLSALLSIGLFDVRGGAAINPIYEITAPVFDTINIKLDENYYPGKQFIIIADKKSNDDFYIRSITLNGKKLDRIWITHKELVSGGTLRLKLSNTPDKKLGTKNLPPSMSDEVIP